MLNQLKKHCTPELLSEVFGNVNLEDVLSTCRLNVEDFSSNCSSLQNVMKVLYVFEKFGGELCLHNELTQFPVLIRNMGDINLTKISLFWHHNESNGVIPVYGVEEIVVPNILPVFVATQQYDGRWGIEKLCQGQYRQLQNGIYPNDLIAKQSAL